MLGTGAVRETIRATPGTWASTVAVSTTATRASTNKCVLFGLFNHSTIGFVRWGVAGGSFEPAKAKGRVASEPSLLFAQIKVIEVLTPSVCKLYAHKKRSYRFLLVTH